MFELKTKNGYVVKAYKTKQDQGLIVVDGVEYEIETVVAILKGANSISDEDIEDFESDPDMIQIVEKSEDDIKANRVYSTQEAIDKMMSGEL